MSELRNLGSWFDSNFTTSTHISHIFSPERGVFFRLYSIKQISIFLAGDKLEMVLHAFVTSRIDYCNGLLYGLPDCEITKLQGVQNAAARLLTSSRKYDYVTSVGGVVTSSALVSEVSGPGSSLGRGHCVVFLRKTLKSHGASLHPGV